MDTKTRLGMKKIVAELVVRYAMKQGTTEPTAEVDIEEALKTSKVPVHLLEYRGTLPTGLYFVNKYNYRDEEIYVFYDFTAKEFTVVRQKRT